MENKCLNAWIFFLVITFSFNLANLVFSFRFQRPKIYLCSFVGAESRDITKFEMFVFEPLDSRTFRIRIQVRIQLYDEPIKFVVLEELCPYIIVLGI